LGLLDPSGHDWEKGFFTPISKGCIQCMTDDANITRRVSKLRVDPVKTWTVGLSAWRKIKFDAAKLTFSNVNPSLQLR